MSKNKEKCILNYLHIDKATIKPKNIDADT